MLCVFPITCMDEHLPMILCGLYSHYCTAETISCLHSTPSCYRLYFTRSCAFMAFIPRNMFVGSCLHAVQGQYQGCKLKTSHLIGESHLWPSSYEPQGARHGVAAFALLPVSFAMSRATRGGGELDYRRNRLLFMSRWETVSPCYTQK